jgi:CIC family chloride channel protein
MTPILTPSIGNIITTVGQSSSLVLTRKRYDQKKVANPSTPGGTPLRKPTGRYNYQDQALLVLTLIIGAVVGLVVVAFILLTERLGSRLYPAGGAAWRRVLIPIVGSLFSGFLLYRYFPDARGSGIPQTKAALFLRNGYISFRTVLGKFGLCSASLASGIALGREGPSVHVGAGIASTLGRRLGLSPATVKSLVPAGASAALAAAFNTPISAVLFTLEEVMGDMHAPVLGSIVLSSATSWIVLHLILGDEPLFHVPPYQLVHPLEFLWYAVLGVAGGLVSTCFVKLLLWQRKYFLTVKWMPWALPALGGLTVGLLGWFFPDVLGVGYAVVDKALNNQLLTATMAVLVLLKVFATATCYSSGNAGGIFGPSLFIGAMLGGAVGGAAHILMPDYTGSAGAYALVGMGTAFAGIVRVPLTSVIMVFEITRDYSIIVPLMIANLISYFISSSLQEQPIYEALDHQDGIQLPSSARTRPGLVEAGEEQVSNVSARAMAGILALLVALLLVAGVLTYSYSAERSKRADQYYRAGNDLFRQDRVSEAILEYRNALSVSHQPEHRQALGLALVKAGRLNEAELYLNQVLRDRPGSGPANAGLAEIYAQQGRLDDAVLHYQRAIYGSWQDDPAHNRVQARLKLIDLLKKSGRQVQARAELMTLAANAPNEAPIQKQVGHMLLDYGLNREAADLFRNLLKTGPPDADEYDGLGRAEFALGRYKPALQAFQSALKIDPADPLATQRVDTGERILALDPNQRGIGAGERHRRSRELLSQVVSRLVACKDLKQELQAAQSSLAKNADDTLAQAEKLWMERCPSAPADEVLGRILQ